jgi:hypothetical protein
MNFQQAFNSAKSKLAAKSALARALLEVPAKVWLAAAALILLGLWLQEHDGRVRRAAELQSLQQQAAARVHALQARSDAALRRANRRNAAAIAGLEAQRRTLTRRSAALSAELATLREKRQEQTQEIAALPPGALEQRLAKELGPSSLVLGVSASSPRADHAPLALSEHGQRQVVSALAERDDCREESGLKDQQLLTCSERATAEGAEIGKQADSLTQLRQALDAQAQMRAARRKEFDAQLRAARGTWSSRALHALKFLAVGVAIGEVLR